MTILGEGLRGGLQRARERFHISSPRPSTTNLNQEIKPYQASYFDFPRKFFGEHFLELVQTIIPQEFSVGGVLTDGDIRYRFIHLPASPEERVKRIAEIIENGSDRTNPSFISNYAFVYDEVANGTGISPLNIIDCYWPRTVYREAARDGLESELRKRHANALLIYDAKTELGIRWLDETCGCEYTFQDPTQKHKALLAVIGLN